MKKNKKMNKTKKPLSKDAKKIIIIGVAFLLVFSAIFGLKMFTKYGLSNSTDIYKVTNTIIKFMPESVVIETNSGDIEFFMEKTEEYDEVFSNSYSSEEDRYDLSKLDIYKALRFYYYDSQNQRVDLTDGQYITTADNIIVISHFTEKFAEKFQLADNIYTGFLVALICGFIIYLIYVWFKAWSVKEDKRIAELKQINSPKKKKDDEE